MFALLSLLLPMNEVDLVLARNAGYMSKVKSLSVDFKVALVAPFVSGNGRLVYEFPRRTRFDVKLNPIDYSLAASEEGILEIERSTKYYMEDLEAEFVGVPASKISYGPQLGFPFVLLKKSVRAHLAENAQYTYQGQTTIGGQKVDKLQASWSTLDGSGSGVILIDSEGKLVMLDWKGTRMGRPTGDKMEFSNYAVNEAVPMSTFRMSVPSGFVPYSLPALVYPPEIGAKVKLGVWNKAGAGKVDLDKELAGKPALLFVMDPACEASGRAAGLVEALGKSIRVVELLSDTAENVRVGRNRFYLGGEAIKTLSPPVTPTFYLLGPDGTLHRVWYGYDAERRKVLEDDMRAAIAELK
jgi:hypothetical protein